MFFSATTNSGRFLIRFLTNFDFTLYTYIYIYSRLLFNFRIVIEAIVGPENVPKFFLRYIV